MSEQVQRDHFGSVNDEVFDQRNLKMKLRKEDGTKLQTLQNHHLERSQIRFSKISPSDYFIFISSKVGDRDFNFDLPPFNHSTNPSASFSSCSSKSSSHSALESVKPKGLPRLAMRKLSASNNNNKHHHHHHHVISSSSSWSVIMTVLCGLFGFLTYGSTA